MSDARKLDDMEPASLKRADSSACPFSAHMLVSWYDCPSHDGLLKMTFRTATSFLGFERDMAGTLSAETETIANIFCKPNNLTVFFSLVVITPGSAAIDQWIKGSTLHSYSLDCLSQVFRWVDWKS